MPFPGSPFLAGTPGRAFLELAAISTRFFHGDALRAVLRRYGGVPAVPAPRRGAAVRAHYFEGYGPVGFARALPHIPQYI